MIPKFQTPLLTDRPEALRSFVEGSGQFQVYLGTGNSSELERASALFQEALDIDPGFDLAVFYHALTRTELRDSTTAIEELRKLIEKGVDFLPEAYLHLAYAHTKKYRDEDYYQAETALDRATAEAKRTGERTLSPIIKAYRVFLYSVMGGRLKNADNEKRTRYLDKAIHLGKTRLLALFWLHDQYSKPLIKLELHNALGIAYLRKGQMSINFSKQQARYWRLASKHFQAALGLGLNPVRVHQNIGTLLRVQARQFRERNHQGDQEKAQDIYQKAAQEYQISIAINSLDQFPHYALARLYTRLARWDLAQRHLNSGRLQRGAVSEESWNSVARAVEERNASILAPGDD